MISNVALINESKNFAMLSLGSNKKNPAPAVHESIYICIRAQKDAVKSTAHASGETPVTCFRL